MSAFGQPHRRAYRLLLRGRAPWVPRQPEAALDRFETFNR